MSLRKRKVDKSPARGAEISQIPPVPQDEADQMRADDDGFAMPSDSTEPLLSDNAVVNFVDKYLTTERVLRIREELGPGLGGVVAGVHASLVRDGIGDYQALSQKQQRAVGEIVAKRTRVVLREQA